MGQGGQPVSMDNNGRVNEQHGGGQKMNTMGIDIHKKCSKEKN